MQVIFDFLEPIAQFGGDVFRGLDEAAEYDGFVAVLEQSLDAGK